VARRSDDRELIELLAGGLEGLSTTSPDATAVALALCRDEPEMVGIVATACAQRSHDRGDVITEVSAWEEAACAAARIGDKATARDHAHNALVLTQNMEAPALSNRVVSRLRPFGLRLDPAVTRDRPRYGWGSLTRTEVTVAELVAAGLSGSEIATRLYISPRTVQTHVSHALTKLGLRTRIDLATFVVAQQQH
jgi:DNA-binding NarL/FixJ family response regulator